MPLATGVILLLLSLFMSGLYLDIVRPIGERHADRRS